MTPNLKFGQRLPVHHTVQGLQLALIIIITIYFIFLIGHDALQYLSFMKKNSDLKTSLLEQEKINHNLKEEYQKLNTNGYLEYLARFRLGYVKIGETAYKITQQEVQN